MRRNLFIAICLLCAVNLFAVDLPKFSTAGFYELPNTGREVYSMNLAWRFYKGDVEGTPFSTEFNDSDWQVVSVPHGLEYLPGRGKWLCQLSGYRLVSEAVYTERTFERQAVVLPFRGDHGQK